MIQTHRLEVGHLLTRVIIQHPKLKIITPTDDPILPRDESASADGDIRQLEGLDDVAGLEGPDVGVAAVQGREDPCCGCPC
jgi:hypothetical protein